MDGDRARFWFAGFVLLVFVSGLATGIIVDRTVVRPPAPGFAPGALPRSGGPGGPGGLVGPGGPPGRGGPPAPRVLADRLAGDLGLTDDQRTRLEAALERQRAQLDESHQRFQSEVQSRFDAAQQELRAELEKILTPEQMRQFDELTRRGPGPLRRRAPRRPGL